MSETNVQRNDKDTVFRRQENPAMELTVAVYNIKLGHNPELLEACLFRKQWRRLWV